MAAMRSFMEPMLSFMEPMLRLIGGNADGDGGWHRACRPCWALLLMQLQSRRGQRAKKCCSFRVDFVFCNGCLCLGRAAGVWGFELRGKLGRVPVSSYARATRSPELNLRICLCEVVLTWGTVLRYAWYGAGTDVEHERRAEERRKEGKREEKRQRNGGFRGAEQCAGREGREGESGEGESGTEGRGKTRGEGGKGGEREEGEGERRARRGGGEREAREVARCRERRRARGARECAEASRADGEYDTTRPLRRQVASFLSSYALAMPCPVLPWAMLLQVVCLTDVGHVRYGLECVVLTALRTGVCGTD
eukprot:2975338-Rhodomonas_salina.2